MEAHTKEQDRSEQKQKPQALTGVKVLELGQLIAGPFAGQLLAYHGADVIKVESLFGDPLRTWRGIENDTSIWWSSLARNKRCVTIDLSQPEGQALTRALIDKVDVLIENFKPGTLERWNLDPEDLKAQNPALIVARISGFGQTGPNAHRPGYASVCEAMGGLRHLTGFPGGPPVRPNLSLGDSLAGLHAALGIMMALFQRERAGHGQTVDVAITESVLNMLEATLPEYDRLDTIRGPSGTTITGVAPTGTYKTKDDRWLVIGANGERLFASVCKVIGRPELAKDPRFSSNPARVKNSEALDNAISTWVEARLLDDACAALEAGGVPYGPVYNAANILEDPHYAARELFEHVQHEGRNMMLPAMAPKLSASSGKTKWAGPPLGTHTAEVLNELLNMDAPSISALSKKGVIRCAEDG